MKRFVVLDEMMEPHGEVLAADVGAAELEMARRFGTMRKDLVLFVDPRIVPLVEEEFEGSGDPGVASSLDESSDART